MSSVKSSFRPNWERVSKRRKTAISFAALLFTIAMAGINWYLFTLYDYPAILKLSVILVSAGIWYLGMSSFLASFSWFIFYLRGRNDQVNPENFAVDLGKDTKIAVLFPVYHENIQRVTATAAAMWEELCTHPEGKKFHFFFLSDSRNADIVAQEQYAVFWLTHKYQQGTFYYRHRGANVFAKQGNISDFLRRWGGDYQYMLMMDADSIVPGESAIRMARVMEGNPRIGIVQASLETALHETLFARINRFVGSLFMHIGIMGQYFVHMGNGYYYGHNAIIRTDAFLKNCGLPLLKRWGPYVHRKPLSHDYLEASLIRGGGYEVWNLAFIEAYEELPTNFVDHYQRELRWMIGALEWLQVANSKNIHPSYRIRLVYSALLYASSLVAWVVFLFSLFGLSWAFRHVYQSEYVIAHYGFAFAISFGIFFLVLLLNITMPLIYNFKEKRLHLYGGFVKAFWSVLAYTVMSMFLGSILMASYTQMWWYWIRGKKVNWGEQSRDDRELTTKECWIYFRWMTGVGIILSFLVWKFVIGSYTPAVQSLLHIYSWELCLWYIPMLGGLTLAPFWVRILSKKAKLMKKMSWFQSPTELHSKELFTRIETLYHEIIKQIPDSYTFFDILKDHVFFHFMLKIAPNRPSKYHFWSKRLSENPLQWSNREKRLILQERGLLIRAHEKLIS